MVFGDFVDNGFGSGFRGGTVYERKCVLLLRCRYTNRRRRCQELPYAPLPRISCYKNELGLGQKENTERRHGLLPYRLFDVNMPQLYGEGRNAFVTLQPEIIRKNDEKSIFRIQISLTLWSPRPRSYACALAGGFQGLQGH